MAGRQFYDEHETHGRVNNHIGDDNKFEFDEKRRALTTCCPDVLVRALHNRHANNLSMGNYSGMPMLPTP